MIKSISLVSQYVSSTQMLPDIGIFPFQNGRVQPFNMTSQSTHLAHSHLTRNIDVPHWQHACYGNLFHESIRSTTGGSSSTLLLGLLNARDGPTRGEGSSADVLMELPDCTFVSCLFHLKWKRDGERGAYLLSQRHDPAVSVARFIIGNWL